MEVITIAGAQRQTAADMRDPLGRPLGIEGRAARRRRRARRKARRAKRREEGRGLFRKIGKGVAKVAKKGWKGLKKYNPVLALGRRSARTLIAMNFNGLATKLSRADQKQLRKTWERRLAGNWGKLQKSIQAGKRKQIKRGVNGVEYYHYEPIGISEPASLAAILASAGPVLAALAGLIKSVKQKAQEAGLDLPPAVDEFIDKIPGTAEINSIVDQAKELRPDLFGLTESQIIDEAPIMLSDVGQLLPGQEDRPMNEEELFDTDVDLSEYSKNTGATPGSMLLPLLGVGVALALLAKKK